MVIAEFEQKKKLSRRKYTLYGDRVAVEIKTANETSKYEVDIRDTGDKLHYYAENTKGAYVFFAILILIPVIVTIVRFTNQSINNGHVAATWFCCLGILFLAFIKEHVDDVYLTGGKTNLHFFRNIPSEQKVLQFIDLIKSTKNESLKTEYLAFDDTTDDEEYMHRLKWLKEQKIVTEEEYQNAKIDFEIKRLLE